MAITYTWKITGVKTTSVQGSDNVVVQTHWEKIGKDGKYEGKFVGATPFDTSNIPAGFTFKPFSQLTEDDVLAWVKGVVVGDYERHVNDQILKQIDAKRNPVVDATLPWAANTANTK